MKLDVIVPIYNVESKLKKCIESLITQQTENLDVNLILVNDGSTDNSREYCKGICSKVP